MSFMCSSMRLITKQPRVGFMSVWLMNGIWRGVSSIFPTCGVSRSFAIWLYTILVELWEETKDERFRRIQCIFKPWPGRLKCVIGHLAENDVRGDLLFIEKALGIAKAKCIYEEQIGKKISQRELELFLRTEGYPITQSNISRMEYTLENLYPYMPTLLNSGMGKGQVIQLISLRSAAQKAWNDFSTSVPVTNDFDTVFGTVCSSVDDPDHYTLETFKDELIAALLQAMPSPEITYDRWLIELDPKEQNRRKLFGEPAPLPQHIINADRGTETETKGEAPPPVGTPVSSPDVPSNDDSHIKEAFPTVHRQPDAVISLQDVKPSVPVDADRGEQRKEEEQPDLYGLPNASRESTLPVTFPLSTSAGTVRQVQQNDDLPPVLESATLDSSVSFANTGLEPVTDIWHISALQDDIEHLQDAAFRLAFELAEVLEAEQELCEDNSMGSAGYCRRAGRNGEEGRLSVRCRGNGYLGVWASAGAGQPGCVRRTVWQTVACRGVAGIAHAMENAG